MLVSIIIPAFNAEQTLAACLEACLRQTYPVTEVIVVDDGSSDGTPEYVRAFPSVRYIAQSNQGPAAARNRGVEASQGDILAFTDADCIPREDWIRQLVDSFDTGVGAVGGTYDIANPQSRLARVVHNEILARHARFEREVDFLGSFNVAYRRSAYAQVGGFDPSFTEASGEDNDLAYRLQDAGYSLRFTPAAVVAHHHPTAFLRYLRTQKRHGFWRVKLYKKHPRRARQGDRYAGLGDLAAPVIGLAVLGLFVPAVLATIFGVGGGGLGAVWAALAILQWSLHFPMTLRFFQRGATIEAFYYGGLVICRDIVRAIGMVQGFWYYHFRGRNGRDG